MNDLTRRKAIRMAATTGVASSGLIMLEHRESNAQQVLNPVSKSGGQAERYFEGESANGTIQEGLDQALLKLEAALPEGGVADAMGTWRMLTVTGQRGGIVPLRTVKVLISAARTPPWPS
jgi:hypothetical protein